MSQIPMVGRGGYIEIDGKPLEFSRWSVKPDVDTIANTNFVNLEWPGHTTCTLVGYWDTYIIGTPRAWANRRRKLRKKWKRYQLQKRKQ